MAFTPNQLFRQALGLTNAVGVDQTLTADETSDCLDKFNDLIEDWNTDNLAVWRTAVSAFATVAGQATYTVGTGGNWNTPRPVRVNSPAYCTYQGVDFPVYSWEQAEYSLVGQKTQQQPIPLQFLFINDFPLASITLWPVPSGVVTMSFDFDTLLSGAATAATSLSFPPGYKKAFLYQLAVELAPLFGKTASADIKAEAVMMLAKIKRANKTTPVARFDSALVDSGPAIWQRGY